MALLLIVALLGIFSEPFEDSRTWLSDLILSKAIGFGAGYAIFRLYGYWSGKDLIPELEELMKEED